MQDLSDFELEVEATPSPQRPQARQIHKAQAVVQGTPSSSPRVHPRAPSNDEVEMTPPRDKPKAPAARIFTLPLTQGLIANAATQPAATGGPAKPAAGPFARPAMPALAGGRFGRPGVVAASTSKFGRITDEPSTSKKGLVVDKENRTLPTSTASRLGVGVASKLIEATRAANEAVLKQRKEREAEEAARAARLAQDAEALEDEKQERINKSRKKSVRAPVVASGPADVDGADPTTAPKARARARKPTQKEPKAPPRPRKRAVIESDASDEGGRDEGQDGEGEKQVRRSGRAARTQRKSLREQSDSDQDGAAYTDDEGEVSDYAKDVDEEADEERRQARRATRTRKQKKDEEGDTPGQAEEQEEEGGAGPSTSAKEPAAKKPRAPRKSSGKKKKEMWTTTVDASGNVIVKMKVSKGKGPGGASVKLNLKRKGGQGRFKASRTSGQNKGKFKKFRSKFDSAIGQAGVQGIDEDLALEMGGDVPKTVEGAKMNLTGVNGAVATAAKRKGICYRCGEEGHWANDCPHVKRKDPKAPKRMLGNLVLDNTDDEDDDGLVLPVSKRAKTAATEDAAKDAEEERKRLETERQLEAQADVPGLRRVEVDPDLVATDDAPTWSPLPALPASVLTHERLRAALKASFGHEDFRDMQLDIVQRTLRGESTLAILPTGHGKSLLYQLPALLMSRAYGGAALQAANDRDASTKQLLESWCTTEELPTVAEEDAPLGLCALVISPLIALMKDQLNKLPLSLNGAMLCKGQSGSESSRILKALESGSLHVLFVSPERLTTAAFRRALKKCGRVGLVCIDEAHCIASWGHSFRPAYLKLASFLKEFGRPHALLALTATATQEAAQQICSTLGLDPASQITRSPHVLPRCMLLKSLKCKGAVDSLTFKQELGRQFEEGLLKNHASVLVYVNFQQAADSLASYLAEKHNLPVMSYHAGKKDSERIRVQDAFSAGSLRAVVATVAYGMGLDNRHVTAVVHVGTPRSLEDLVQMAGRAGRSGDSASSETPSREVLCLTYPDNEELVRLRSLARSEGVDQPQIRAFLRVLFHRDPHPHPLGFKQRTAKPLASASDAPYSLLDMVVLENAVGLKVEVMESVLALLEAGVVLGRKKGEENTLSGALLRHETVVKGLVDFAFYSTDLETFIDELKADHVKAMEEGGLDGSSFAATWMDTAEGRAAGVLKAVKSVCIRPNSGGKFPISLRDLAAESGLPPLSVLRTLPLIARRGASCQVHGNDHVALKMLVDPKDVDVDALAVTVYDHLTGGESKGVERLDLAYSCLTAVAEPCAAFWQAKLAVGETEERSASTSVLGSGDVRAAIQEYFLVGSEGPIIQAAKIAAPLPLRTLNSLHAARDVRSVAEALESTSTRLNDRVVTRFLHGLTSPEVPAQSWSRNPMWGRYKDCDFAELLVLARRELRARFLEGIGLAPDAKITVVTDEAIAGGSASDDNSGEEESGSEDSGGEAGEDGDEEFDGGSESEGDEMDVDIAEDEPAADGEAS